MFRCPTCIGVLADPTSRRCHMCGQRLRRRRQRVLGEERRPGARLLPVERALHERLHGTSKPGGRRQYQPPPWAERYTSSASVATAARMLADKAPTGSGSGIARLAAPPELRFDAYAAPVAASTPVEDTPTRDLAALDVPAYLSSFEPAHDLIADPVEVEVAPDQVRAGREVERDAARAVEVSTYTPDQHEAQYELDGPLDPEVQALVDDLYRRARAEIVGSFVGLEQAGELPPNTPRRRGWVPAVLADRRRHDGTGNAKRPNGNGWRRLD
jgi:hypothetical protein